MERGGAAEAAEELSGTDGPLQPPPLCHMCLGVHRTRGRGQEVRILFPVSHRPRLHLCPDISASIKVLTMAVIQPVAHSQAITGPDPE